MAKAQMMKMLNRQRGHLTITQRSRKCVAKTELKFIEAEYR